LLKAKLDGLPIITDRQTVKDFLLSWLETVRPSLRARAWRRYSEYVRLHAVPEFGRILLSRLTPQHLQRLYARKLEQGLSAMTVRHLHAMLHKALADAARWGLVARNVGDLATPPRVERQEMKTLIPQEAFWRPLLYQLSYAPAPSEYSKVARIRVKDGRRPGLEAPAPGPDSW